MKRLASLILVMCAACMTALAQQHYEIYPVPQHQLPGAGTARISGRVNIVAGTGIDDATVARARRVLAEAGLDSSVSRQTAAGATNLLLGICGSGDAADCEAGRLGLDRSIFSQPQYDRHIVSLTADKKGRGQLLILGEHTEAVFCGLATIEQMLDRDTAAMPCVTVFDGADIRSRGIIEGYYGVPYNAEVTKDLFRFMARCKMNTYMYGAKSDPYHTRYWDAPYPKTITAEQQRIGYLTQDMLRDIVAEAHASKVNFIWAIHPGDDFVNKECTDVIDRIMAKFQSMYDLGVRQFGVFVDDVGVPYDRPSQLFGAERLAQLQNRIDRQWNSGDAAPADRVKPLQYVPQLYAYSWTSPERAQTFFESLSCTPSEIDIYITGAKVWSVPNSGDLALVNRWLGREVAWWWNYPCNDNDMTKLFMEDMYTNFRSEKHIDGRARMEPALKGATTLIANPMQQGEASKIALFGIADYAWNNEAFDNGRNWLASLRAVVGSERAGALRCVLPYLSYFDEDVLSKLVDDYKESVADGHPRPEPLVAVLTEVLASCRVLDGMASSASESDRLFHEDIRPWLTKLESMLQMTLCMIEGREVVDGRDLENDESFRFEILTGMGEGISLGVKTAEPSARVLRPFIDWLRARQ